MPRQPSTPPPLPPGRCPDCGHAPPRSAAVARVRGLVGLDVACRELLQALYLIDDERCGCRSGFHAGEVPAATLTGLLPG